MLLERYVCLILVIKTIFKILYEQFTKEETQITNKYSVQIFKGMHIDNMLLAKNNYGRAH